MKRARAVRWIGRGAVVVAALALLLWFSTAHYGERVTLDLWIVTLRDVPLPFALYGAAIAGMAFILLIGLRADLETRRLLQRYRAIAELERAAQRVRGSGDEAAHPGDAGIEEGVTEEGRGQPQGGGTGERGERGEGGKGEKEGKGRSRLEDARQVAGPE